jgi:hypothetical protein
MLEQTKKRTVDKSPVRIRPPDVTPAEVSPRPTDPSWSAGLSVPSAESVLPRWLSVEQVRKMQRMRRETVLNAMQAGELPFERRGRICYVRLSDVVAWEERRLKSETKPSRCFIHPDLAGLA